MTDHIQDEIVKDLSKKEIADAINKAFLEPLDDYRLPRTLDKVPLENENAEFPKVSEWRVQMTLSRLNHNPSKATGV